MPHKTLSAIPNNIKIFYNPDGIPTHYQVPGYAKHRIKIWKEAKHLQLKSPEEFERYKNKRLAGKGVGLTGSTDEVALGLRKHTPGKKTKKDIMVNAQGRFVLKSRYNHGLRNVHYLGTGF